MSIDVSVRAEPLYGEINAIASFLSSATEISLFAILCAVSLEYPAEPINRKSTFTFSVFANKSYPLRSSPRVDVNDPLLLNDAPPS